MKPRHAAALALLGSYLTASPFVANGADSPKLKLFTYTNQTHGFSFQYPSDWILKQGKEAELNWGYLGQVGAIDDVPDVAIEMPVASYYKDSDVQMAFMIVTVYSGGRSADCTEGSPKERVGSTEFAKWSDGEGYTSHGYYIEYYATFRSGFCLNFGLGEGKDYGDPAAIKVPDHSVFRRLRAVLASVKFSRPKNLASTKGQAN
jgi:hypothetical protein